LSLPSWRVGYLISHPETVDAILNYHDPVYISVPILQHALATYLRDHLDDYTAHIARSNDIMQRNLAKLGPALAERFGWKFLAPQGSMYAMFRHHEASDLAAVLAALKAGVGVAGGGMFFEGSPANTGFIRIHVGLSEERVDALLQVIKRK
jgi:DNA-binding transcriptional MocR family regulator